MILSLPLKGRLVVYGVLGLVGWLALARLSGPSVDDSIHQRQTEAILKAGKAYRAQLQRDKETIAQLRRKAASHIGKADTLRLQRENIPLPPVTPPEALPYVLRLKLAEAETVELRDALKSAMSALDTASAALDRVEQRADTLENLLRTRPKPCRILGVACPKVGIGPTIGKELKPDLRIGIFIPIL